MKFEAEDRLSSLPDELLHHIFSFSDDYRDVIKTGGLSRRWRVLHASVPALSLANTRGTADLEALIASCLALRDRSFPVVDLSLDAGDGLSPESIEALLAAASQMALRRLQLAGDWVKSLPDCLYTTTSLKELTLRSKHMNLSSNQGFPTLTTLRLESFNLSTDIISKCPNLETLILNDCNIYINSDTVNIKALKLKTLAISFPYDLWYMNRDCEIVFDAPRLVRVTYRGVEALNFRMESLPRALEEVQIDVFQGKYELYDDGFTADEKINKVNGVVKMLDAFKLAKTIKLSQPTIKCLRGACGSIKMENCCNGRLRDILQNPANSSHQYIYLSTVK